jgi:hypothetical protein
MRPPQRGLDATRPRPEDGAIATSRRRHFFAARGAAKRRGKKVLRATWTGAGFASDRGYGDGAAASPEEALIGNQSRPQHCTQNCWRFRCRCSWFASDRRKGSIKRLPLVGPASSPPLSYLILPIAKVPLDARICRPCCRKFKNTAPPVVATLAEGDGRGSVLGRRTSAGLCAQLPSPRALDRCYVDMRHHCVHCALRRRPVGISEGVRSARGTICQDSPNLSLHQPHCDPRRHFRRLHPSRDRSRPRCRYRPEN